MARALALLMVVVAAFIVLMAVLAVFAGIAPALPTTEESFLKIGPTEVEGAVLTIVGAVLVAGGYFLTRLAGSIYR